MNKIPPHLRNHVHIPRTYREATGRHPAFQEWKEADDLSLLDWILLAGFALCVAGWIVVGV